MVCSVRRQYPDEADDVNHREKEIMDMWKALQVRGSTISLVLVVLQGFDKPFLCQFAFCRMFTSRLVRSHFVQLFFVCLDCCIFHASVLLVLFIGPTRR